MADTSKALAYDGAVDLAARDCSPSIASGNSFTGERRWLSDHPSRQRRDRLFVGDLGWRHRREKCVLGLRVGLRKAVSTGRCQLDFGITASTTGKLPAKETQ